MRRILTILLVLVGLPAAGTAEPNETVVEVDTGEGDVRVSGRFYDAKKLGFVHVEAGEGNSWTSPLRPIWKLDAADVDGDGVDEVLYGMWSTKNHHRESGRPRSVWVMRWDGLRMIPLWRGSSLARPLRDFTAADLDDDGRAELVAIEKNGQDACVLTVYRWVGFGFSGVDSHPLACEASLAEKPGCVSVGDDKLCAHLNDTELDLK